MNFERSDGVIIQVVEREESLVCYCTNLTGTQASSELLYGSLIFPKDRVHDSDDFPDYSCVHELASWAACRITNCQDPDSSRLLVSDTIVVNLRDPTEAECPSLSRMIAFCTKLGEFMDSQKLVETKRNLNVAKKELAHFETSKLRLCRYIEESQRREADDSDKDREEENVYRNEILTAAIEDEIRSEKNLILDTKRCERISEKLAARKRREAEFLKNILEIPVECLKSTKPNQNKLNGSSMSELEQQTKEDLDAKRGLNIRARLARRMDRQKTYVHILEDQRNQLVRKSRIIREKRQALAHELFCRPL